MGGGIIVTAYLRGAAKEREVQTLLTQLSWLTVRSAGSKGLFDIWAHDGQVLRLIQCKAQKACMSKAERDRIAGHKPPPGSLKEIWHVGVAATRRLVKGRQPVHVAYYLTPRSGVKRKITFSVERWCDESEKFVFIQELSDII